MKEAKMKSVNDSSYFFFFTLGSSYCHHVGKDLSTNTVIGSDQNLHVLNVRGLRF